MKNGLKLMAIATALMMMAVAGFVILNQTEGSDATPQSVTSNVTFHIYDTTAVTPAWVDATASGYDAYQALAALNGVTHTVTYSSLATYSTPNSSWKIGIWSDTYSQMFDYPNCEYGLFASINGVPSSADPGYEWRLYIFSKASDTATQETWGKIDSALGWVQPFEDYLAVDESGRSLASANVALIYCNASTPDLVNYQLISNHVTVYTPLTAIDKTNGSAYEVVFYIEDTIGNAVVNPSTGLSVKFDDYTTGTITTQDLGSGVSIVGYGSSAFTALYDALTNSNVGYYNVAPNVADPSIDYVYYSWTSSIFEVGDDYVAPNWVWWNLYEYGSSSSGADCMFSLGYYSTLVGGYNYSGEFDLIYQ